MSGITCLESETLIVCGNPVHLPILSTFYFSTFAGTSNRQVIHIRKHRIYGLKKIAEEKRKNA